MTDPQDELGARFNNRRADSEETESEESSEDKGSHDLNQPETTDNTDSSDTADNSYNTSDADSTDNTSKPGPDPNPDSTRNRRQVPMYLPEQKVDRLNNLYDRLDGQSKLAGDGGIEKHADFMETLVELAIEHEDELAARLNVEK
jgi:hypothetical protein